jgi:hypothetical protein
MVGGEYLEKNRDAPLADRQRSLDSVEILDASGEERRLVLSVLKFGVAPRQQFVSRGCVLIESLLLKGREPGFHHRPDSTLLDLLVTDGAVTYLLD